MWVELDLFSNFSQFCLITYIYSVTFCDPFWGDGLPSLQCCACPVRVPSPSPGGYLLIFFVLIAYIFTFNFSAWKKKKDFFDQGGKSKLPSSSQVLSSSHPVSPHVVFQAKPFSFLKVAYFRKYILPFVASFRAIEQRSWSMSSFEDSFILLFDCCYRFFHHIFIWSPLIPSF